MPYTPSFTSYIGQRFGGPQSPPKLDLQVRTPGSVLLDFSSGVQHWGTLPSLGMPSDAMLEEGGGWYINEKGQRTKKKKAASDEAATNPFMDVISPITAQGVYSPGQTEKAINQLYSQAHVAGADAEKAFDRPGVSRSAGTRLAAQNTVTLPALADAMEGTEGVRLSDRLTNQQNLLATQSLRDEFANRGAMSYLNRQGGQQDEQFRLLNLLMQMMG